MAKNGEKMHFLSFRALLDPFFHNFPNRCFSNMQGEVLRGSKKPTSIVAMLMHFFRVTTAKEGCGDLRADTIQFFQHFYTTSVYTTSVKRKVTNQYKIISQKFRIWVSLHQPE